MKGFIRVTTSQGPALVAVDEIAAVIGEMGVDKVGTPERTFKKRSAIWLKRGRTIRPSQSVATILKRIEAAS